jgi:hypothetical protein
MYTLVFILSDFERPLNTSLEDSIHMPQNHNDRIGRNAQSPPAYPPLVAASSESSFSIPMWDDASGHIWEIPTTPSRARNRPIFVLDKIPSQRFDQAEVL